MIYIAYKTDPLKNEIENQGLSIDKVQDLLEKSKSKDLFFDKLLLENIDMKNSDMIYKFNEIMKNNNDVSLVFVSDPKETVGRWQGLELIIALKNDLKIYLTTNRIIVSQIKRAIDDSKQLVSSLNTKDYVEFYNFKKGCFAKLMAKLNCANHRKICSKKYQIKKRIEKDN